MLSELKVKKDKKKQISGDERDTNRNGQSDIGREEKYKGRSRQKQKTNKERPTKIVDLERVYLPKKDELIKLVCQHKSLLGDSTVSVEVVQCAIFILILTLKKNTFICIIQGVEKVRIQ